MVRRTAPSLVVAPLNLAFYSFICRAQLLEKWFEVLGTSSQGVIKDLNLYQEQVGKVEQAEMVRQEKKTNTCLSCGPGRGYKYVNIPCSLGIGFDEAVNTFSPRGVLYHLHF